MGLNQPPEGYVCPHCPNPVLLSDAQREGDLGGGLHFSPLALSQKGSISDTFSGAAVHF